MQVTSFQPDIETHDTQAAVAFYLARSGSEESRQNVGPVAVAQFYEVYVEKSLTGPKTFHTCALQVPGEEPQLVGVAFTRSASTLNNGSPDTLVIDTLATDTSHEDSARPAILNYLAQIAVSGGYKHLKVYPEAQRTYYQKAGYTVSGDCVNLDKTS